MTFIPSTAKKENVKKIEKKGEKGKKEEKVGNETFLMISINITTKMVYI